MVRQIAQRIVNRLLSLDPEVQAAFAEFTGKVIKIELTDINSISFLRVEKTNLEILSTFDGEVQATIRGSTVALGQLGIQQIISGVGHQQSVSIEGDLEFVQQFLQLSKKYRLDWEEIFAKAFGDVVGHQIGNGIRSTVNWLCQTSQKMQRDFSEFVQDEIRVTPSPEEMKNFTEDVDTLRGDFDRISLKVSRLIGE